MNKSPKKIATIFIILLSLWMLSGVFKNNSTEQGKKEDKKPFQVVIIDSISENRSVPMNLYGETEAVQQTTIYSEIKSKVQKIQVKEGDVLSKGQEIILLDVKHYRNQLSNAKSVLESEKLKLKSAEKLFKLGLSSEIRLNEAKSALRSVQETLQKAKSDIDNVIIKAPFDGRVENVFVKIGDITGPDKKLIDFASLEKSIIVAYLPEKDAVNLKMGAKSLIRLVDGRKFNGEVMFISNVSEEKMRSFRVEVKILDQINSDQLHQEKIMSGMTAELQIFLHKTKAHKIPQSALSITSKGVIGVKTVNDENMVVFLPVNIILQNSEGMWVAEKNSQSERLKIITSGHVYVSEGEIVDVLELGAENE